MKRIAIVGNLNIDNVIDGSGNVFLERMGGNAIYASAGAKIWNENVSLISRIPKNYPEAYLRLLQDKGIDLSQVKRMPFSVVLSEWFCYQSDGSRIDQIFAPAAKVASQWPSIRSGHCSPDEKEAITAFIRDYPASPAEHTFADFRSAFPVDLSRLADKSFRANGFHLTPNKPAEQEKCAQYAKSIGSIVMLDPQPPHTKDKQEHLIHLLRFVDIFMPSQMELDLLCPGMEMHEALHDLAEMGPKVTGVKLGSDGCLVYDAAKGRYAAIPAFPADPKNLTGAGDCFCGGFLAGYLETGDPFLAAEYGTISASMKIEKIDMEETLSCSGETAHSRLEKFHGMISSYRGL